MTDNHVSLNMNVRGLEQSATIAINDRSKNLDENGKHIYRLGLGQSPFPVPLNVVNALKQNAHQKDYLPAAGLRQLRQTVAEFHRRKDGVEASADGVIIGPGSKELMFILQIVFYGELMVPTPCWVSYMPQANIIGKKVSHVHTRKEHRWMMSAEALEEHLRKQNDRYRPRILILNYPSNPVGCTYPEEELKAIARVAREYELILLSDEIYGQLHHRGRHVSIARYYPEATIISGGLSKWCGAGGWRLGTFTFPPDLQWILEKMSVVASETFTSVCAPIQYAACRAFTGGISIEEYLLHCRRILSTLGNRLATMFNDAGIEVNSPEGGFYLYPDFTRFRKQLKQRGITDSRALCEDLLEETGVAILPGASFGRDAKELTARLAYVDFDGAEALAKSKMHAVDKPLPDDFPEKCAFNVIKSAQTIIDWVKG
jgi:aspartate aminotransferase